MAGFSCIAFFWVRSFLLAPVMNLGGGEVVFFLTPKGVVSQIVMTRKKAQKATFFAIGKHPFFRWLKGCTQKNDEIENLL